MPRKPKILLKEDLLRAMKNTRSNRAAARYLRVSYSHYKKYAKLYKDEETGKNLLEVHKNQAGVGIPKYLNNNGKEPPLQDLIEGRVPIEHFNPKKIKIRLLNEGLINEYCSKCGFCEKRLEDLKIPLIVHHKDGDKKNWRLDNLEMLCYNCSFLYAISPITEEQVDAAEDYLDRNVEDIDWEIDEHMKEHLKNLNLNPQEEETSKYIDKW